MNCCSIWPCHDFDRALVWVAIGWREALVVAIVIPVTILLTLFAARIMGYTLNRVSPVCADLLHRHSGG
jgi:hypothetical protein